MERSESSEISGSCFNLPKAMKRNQAARVQEQRIRSDHHTREETKTQRREDLSGQCHMELPSHSPIFLLMLRVLPDFPQGITPSLCLSRWFTRAWLYLT